MSYWTHVNSAFRVNLVRPLQPALDFDEIFGKTYPFDDINSYEDYEAAEKEHWLPHSNEKSCIMDIWEEPNMHSTAAYTVTVFGDLSSHTTTSDIIDWFIKTCRRLGQYHIRQAMITVETECSGQTQTAVYVNGEVKTVTYNKNGDVVDTATTKQLFERGEISN